MGDTTHMMLRKGTNQRTDAETHGAERGGEIKRVVRFLLG
jgi:hypothetical protein